MSDIVLNNMKEILEKNGIDYEEFKHEPVFTSEEAADERGVDPKTGVKALVFKGSDGFIMALVPGDKRVDTKELQEVSGQKGVKLASPEQVLKITGCEIGSVSPFGHKNALETYMDKGILENEYVNFNAGLHEVSFTMKSGDLKKVMNPIMCDIADYS